MDISEKIKGLLAFKNIKQQDLIEILQVSSKQSLSVKFKRGSWSVEDLIKICNFCDCDLVINVDDTKICLNEKHNEVEKWQ